MEKEKIKRLAKVIWDYHHMDQRLEKADCILVLGSHDLRIAEYGAKLFLDGWAPLLIFSGGLGRLTREIWNEYEAEKFAEVAIKLGIPKNKILIENKSTNTGENIIFVKNMLEEKKINISKFILVQKPYMERRAYATFKKILPEKEVVVTSPPISFSEYPDNFRTEEDTINILVGDLQRIKIYSESGFQIPQEIPDNVWKAYKALVAEGYIKHLVKERGNIC